MEYLTRKMEEAAYEYFRKLDAMGGMIPAIERGFPQKEIADAAYRYQREIDEKRRIVVGVNEYISDEPITIPLLKMDPEGEKRHRERLARVRRERDNEKVRQCLERLRNAAEDENENLMPYIIDCVRAYATLGEIMKVLRQVFGEYREPIII